MACVAVLSLMRTLELEFLQPHPRPILLKKKLIPCNKELAQSLHQKLGFLIEMFDESRMDGIQAIKDLETKLRDVSFRVEDEIEFQITNLYEEEEEKEEIESEEEGYTNLQKTCHPFKISHILEQAIKDIDVIKEELDIVKMEHTHFIALQGRKTKLDAFTKCDGVISTGHALHSKDIMVGRNNEFRIVKKMLIEHPSRQREIVSIKGMGGIGKTTLARRVYEDPSIASHFDKRAWVVASQHHSKRQMLAGLLKSMGNNGIAAVMRS